MRTYQAHLDTYQAHLDTYQAHLDTYQAHLDAGSKHSTPCPFKLTDGPQWACHSY